MDQHSKAELIKTYRKRYLRAAKLEKSRIIDAIVEATQYSRKHVIRALGQKRSIPKRVNRRRTSRYQPIIEILKQVWAASNFLCGKRLKPFLPHLVKALKRHGKLTLTKDQESLLLSASSATIDRLLVRARQGLGYKGRSTTKPGTLLKDKIPIRTFADWNDNLPGFLEIDLVAHCGDTTAGEYINTLNMTDVATGWAACVPFMGRSERFCVTAIEKARSGLPFALVGIDSDNGGEFINAHLLRYCKRNTLTFTRGRPGKKNDQCRVEQKNWDIVRKMIGYRRFDTKEQLGILKRIYSLLTLYQNYFQPSQKLTEKHRIGSKVRKKYDDAQTPCQRLLSRKDIPQDTKKRLRQTFRNTNPAQLLRDIQSLITKLYNT
jgi:hypothetical protein